MKCVDVLNNVNEIYQVSISMGSLFCFKHLKEEQKKLKEGADLEADDGDFVTGEISQWEWGTPNSGPGNAFSGSRVWGTNLSGNYLNNSQDLIYNIFDIPESGPPVILRFMAWYALESEYDYLHVESRSTCFYPSVLIIATPPLVFVPFVTRGGFLQ